MNNKYIDNKLQEARGIMAGLFADVAEGKSPTMAFDKSMQFIKEALDMATDKSYLQGFEEGYDHVLHKVSELSNKSEQEECPTCHSKHKGFDSKKFMKAAKALQEEACSCHCHSGCEIKLKCGDWYPCTHCQKPEQTIDKKLTSYGKEEETEI